MKRQKTMFQTKQDKKAEKNTNETVISNLPFKEFTVIIIMILTEHRRKLQECSENLIRI